MSVVSEGGRLAAAIAGSLNGAKFSKPFTAAVGYGLRLKLEDADTLRVDVAPFRSTAELETRGSVRWTHVVDIGVRYRFGLRDQNTRTGQITPESVDEYRCLLQEIVHWCFQQARLTDMNVDAAIVEDPSPRRRTAKHFDEWGQFTGLRVQYMTVTEIHDRIEAKLDRELTGTLATVGEGIFSPISAARLRTTARR